MESSISLEETNRVRVSLGLRPLGEAAPTVEGEEPEVDKDKEAEDNWERRKEEDRKAAETKILQEKIAKAKNKRELNAKQTGATLGDESAGDTSSWAKNLKKQAKLKAERKKLEDKRREEEEEMDRLGAEDKYTEKDLAGIKVSHDMDDFEEGEHILTLKDSRILDGEEDELMNVDLAGHEDDEKNVELKRKRKEYSGYDDDEFDPSMLGMKKKVLSKYDVDLEGGAGEELGFRLGGSVAPKKKKSDRAGLGEDEEMEGNVNRTLLEGGLSYEKAREVSDYLQEGEAGFKKPKKKKKRSTRVAEVDDSEPPVASTSTLPSDSMQVDSSAVAAPPPPPPTENFIDDDELQAALAAARRKKSKKVVKFTPEDIARQLAEQKAEEDTRLAVELASASAAQVHAEDGTIQFDDTSEFVRSIAIPQAPVVKVIQISTAPEASSSSSSAVKAEEEDVDLNALVGDVDMEGGAEEEEEEGDDLLGETALRLGLSIEEMRIKADKDLREAEAAEELVLGTAQEVSLGRGLAGALAMLKSTGNISSSDPATIERERVQKEKDMWLADARRRTAKLHLEKIQARGGNKDQATREYENRMREQREAADAVERYKNYKPDIQIVYHDEFGRNLTPKEAWKALSHKFHGKGSGKGKTDKRLAKIKQEMKASSVTMGDSSMSANFNERQAKVGQAHMVLSVGNKGSIPEEQKGKGKGRK
ncbi:SART-1 protein [Mrakia frigida]|uniref:U4/U6-U5 snRNP complex subunit SNU66 n=1 Tax=Mrakia frigida TaxID=29902 RepID=UPI003FCC115E